MLSGSLQAGVIGVMAIDNNEEYCYGQLMKAQNFLRKQGSDLKDKYQKKNSDFRSDLIDIHDIYGRIKVKLKGLIEKKCKTTKSNKLTI